MTYPMDVLLNYYLAQRKFQFKSVGIDIYYRCKDCCHRVEGHCTHHTWYTSMVCDLRPKKTLPNTFYAAPYGQKSCEKFELKDN